MFGKWLKPYLPRSLFGRAFLILIVPIVLIQVVVGIIFVERLFQDVTRQMTRSIAIDLNFLTDVARRGDDPAAIGKDLDITVSLLTAQQGTGVEDERNSLDISGLYVIETLHAEVSDLVAVDLARERNVVFASVAVGDKIVVLEFSRRRVSAANPHQLLVAMVLAALMLTTLSALFLHNQIQPIRRLSAAAEAFGKGQRVALSPRGASEVRSAAHSFLSMRSRIERQIEQRTMMLSGVSHDLRTPLTRLKLSLSLMEDGEESTLMRRDVDEMEDILDEFLAFSRGDAGEKTEAVSLKTLAKQLVRNHKRSGADIKLSFEGKREADPPVHIRRLAVQRAVSNLLSNAIRYGEKVQMTVYVGTGFVEFSVEDDGPGIKKDQREAAVRAFSRLDKARNQDKGSGVGLGLAIAADVARSHGGELLLHRSQALGGLRASFRIPR